MELLAKSLSRAEKSRTFLDGSTRSVVILETVAIGRGEYRPGWQWSAHAGAQTGKPSAAHIGYVVSGRMTIRTAGGGEVTVGPGEAFEVGRVTTPGSLATSPVLRSTSSLSLCVNVRGTGSARQKACARLAGSYPERNLATGCRELAIGSRGPGRGRNVGSRGCNPRTAGHNKDNQPRGGLTCRGDGPAPLGPNSMGAFPNPQASPAATHRVCPPGNVAGPKRAKMGADGKTTIAYGSEGARRWVAVGETHGSWGAR